MVDELRNAMAELDALGAAYRTLWNLIAIEPVRWRCDQYEEAEDPWVIAVMGERCIYYNEVEEGWGWGGFSSWGVISAYHWEQYEIPQVVVRTLHALSPAQSP